DGLKSDIPASREGLNLPKPSLQKFSSSAVVPLGVRGPMIDHEQLLRYLAERGGSDLHLKVGSPPLVRIDGELQRVGDAAVKTDDVGRIAQAIMPQERADDLRGKHEADFAYSMPGVGRFRCNVFKQRGSISVAMRRIRIGSPTFEELGLPPVVSELSDQHR